MADVSGADPRGGGVDGVASHPPQAFTYPFVHNTIGDGLPWLASHPMRQSWGLIMGAYYGDLKIECMHG